MTSSLQNPGGGRGRLLVEEEDPRRTRRKILEREVLNLMIQKKEQEKGGETYEVDDEYEEVIFDPVKAALETNALMFGQQQQQQKRKQRATNQSSLRRKSNSDSDLYVMDENREIELCSRTGLDSCSRSSAVTDLPDDATFCSYAEPEQGFYRVYDDLERIREWDLIPYVIARKRREEEEREEISSNNKDPAAEKESKSSAAESHRANTSDDSGRASVISRLSGSTVRSKRIHSDSGSNCSADSGTYHLFDSKARPTNSSGAAAAGDTKGIKPVNDVLAQVSDELLKIASNGAEKEEEEEKDEVICSSSNKKRVVLKLSPKFVRDKPHPPTPPVSLRKPPPSLSVSQKTESTNPITVRLKMFEKEFYDQKSSSSSTTTEQRRGALVKRSNGFSCPSSRAGHAKQQQKQNKSSPPPPPLPPRSSLKTNSSSSSTSSATFGSSSQKQQKRKDLSSYFGLLQDDQNLPYSKEVAQTVALQSLSTDLNNAAAASSACLAATSTTPPGKKDLNKFLGIHSQLQKKKEEEVVSGSSNNSSSSSSSSMLLTPSSLLKRFSHGGKNCRQQKGQQQQQLQQQLHSTSSCNNSKEMQNALHPAGLNATLMQRDQFTNAPTAASTTARAVPVPAAAVAAKPSSSSSSSASEVVQSSQKCIKPPSGVMQAAAAASSKREKEIISAASVATEAAAPKENGTPTLRRRIFRNPLRSAAASASKRRSEITCPAIESAVAGERARTPSPYRLKNTPLRRFKSKEYTPRKSFMANLLLNSGNKQRQQHTANLNSIKTAQTVAARSSSSSEEEDIITEIKPVNSNDLKQQSPPVCEPDDEELLEACQRDYSASVNEALKDGLPVIPFCQLHDIEDKGGRLMQQPHCKSNNNCLLDSDGEDNKENSSSSDLVADTPLILSSQLQSRPRGATPGPVVPRKAPSARRSLFFPSPPPPAAKRQQSSLYLTMSTVKAIPKPTASRARSTAAEEQEMGSDYQNDVVLDNQENEDKKNKKIHCRSCTCDLVSPPFANTFPHRIKGGGGIVVGSGSCSSRSSCATTTSILPSSKHKHRHHHQRHEELLKQKFEWESRPRVELDYMKMETCSSSNKFGGSSTAEKKKSSMPWKRKSLTSLLQ